MIQDNNQEELKDKPQKPYGYWLIESNRAEVAKNYKTRASFKLDYQAAYARCSKEELIKYFGLGNHINYKPNGYWDIKENRKLHALECFGRNDFHTKYTQGYNKSTEEELLEYFGEPMSLGERYIYSYEFKDKYIYIGLTSNPKGRNWGHYNKKGTVNDYMIETKEIPIYRLLTEKPIDEKSVGELEDFIIEEYRDMDYNILNKAPGGSLGTCRYKYTKEELFEEALKYSRRIDFLKANKNYYQACVVMKVLQEACSHMLTPGERAFQKHKEIASKYNNRSEYRVGDKFSYSFASAKRWLEIFFPLNNQ